MDSPSGIASLHFEPRLLSIEWRGGGGTRIPSLWLRDNCPEDRDPESGQRLIDVAELPPDPRMRCASIEGERLRIEWESEPRVSSFDVRWLAAHAPGARDSSHDFTRRLWRQAAELDPQADFAWESWPMLRGSDARRLDWLERLLIDGIAFLAEVPCQDAALLECARLIGRVCETNYGETFDVRSVARPENLAYSDRGLKLHTDNPYREPVPGFQALHVLRSSPEGGESVFADGFALAQLLKERAAEAFEALTRTPVGFLYRSADAELYAERPLLQLSCSGALLAVHYNNRSIAPLRLEGDALVRFYSAYRHWAALLDEPSGHLRLHLTDGELVVFNNRRILHGRTGFAAARFARHLKGCYLTQDSVYCTAGVLRRKLRPQ